jgi:hypothetical protein
VVTFLVVMVMIPLLLSSVLRSKQSETEICCSELNTAIIFCSTSQVALANARATSYGFEK